MTTFNPELTFRMEARNGHSYETAARQENARVTERKEQIDLVIGSATKGQTYLYWKQNGLFELPVSYWVLVAEFCAAEVTTSPKGRSGIFRKLTSRPNTGSCC